MMREFPCDFRCPSFSAGIGARFAVGVLLLRCGPAAMRILSYGVTDIGRKRPHNEDDYLCDDRLGLYVVADGVGGHAKGEIASREAVEELVMWVRRHQREIDRQIDL